MPPRDQSTRRRSLPVLLIVGLGVAVLASAGASLSSGSGSRAVPPWPAFAVKSLRGHRAPAAPIAIPADALYVSPAGSDAASGDVRSPWQTLAHALSNAPAGATIVLRSGTYAPTGWLGGDNAAAAGVTIENYPGEAAVVAGASYALLQLENWKDVTIRGGVGGGSLSFVGTWGAGVAGSNNGILIYHAPGAPGYVPSGVTIEGVAVHGIAGYGINLGSTVADDVPSGVGVAGSTVRDVEVYDTATGIRLNHAGLGNVVEGSWIHDNTRMIQDAGTTGYGAVGIALDNIQAAGASKSNPAVTVRDNRISGNSGRSLAYGYDGGAVELYQSSYAAIVGNTMWDNEGGIETGTSSTAMPLVGNVIASNVFYGRGNRNGASPLLLLRAAEDAEVVDNTIDLTSGNDVFRIQECSGEYCGSIANLVVRDNLVIVHSDNQPFAVNKPAFTSPVTIDRNIVFGPVAGIGDKLAGSLVTRFLRPAG